MSEINFYYSKGRTLRNSVWMVRIQYSRFASRLPLRRYGKSVLDFRHSKPYRRRQVFSERHRAWNFAFMDWKFSHNARLEKFLVKWRFHCFPRKKNNWIDLRRRHGKIASASRLCWVFPRRWKLWNWSQLHLFVPWYSKGITNYFNLKKFLSF